MNRGKPPQLCFSDSIGIANWVASAWNHRESWLGWDEPPIRTRPGPSLPSRPPLSHLPSVAASWPVAQKRVDLFDPMMAGVAKGQHMVRFLIFFP